METISTCCEKLASLLRASDEYKACLIAKKAVEADPALMKMLGDYRKLQTRLQASELCGATDEDELLRFQKLGEYLMLDPKASEYLLAEFKLNKLLSDVYMVLARSVDADLSVIDD